MGIGTGAPWLIPVAGATAPVATTCVEGTGDPLGLTVPDAATVLLGLIEAAAVKAPVDGWMISHVRVAVELGLGCAAGVFTSMEKVTVAAAAPSEPVQE
ncbi:hypothetical protein [Nonomuraea turcica]|uniref:hypothetical protein n=1 Tax=Nonomuraea sp. G32 TaxID=3067274 RepID=UPI00273AC934|nr:hypothetical protein [Nonomuraea sp. G32]MDP4501422.1 hypothetical protein [Nonomuraea sp. G32]